MPNTSNGVAGTSLTTSASYPAPGELVTSAGLRTFVDAFTGNFATLKLNFPDIYTAQWTATSSTSVNATFTGFSGTFQANLTLGNYAVMNVNGTGAGIAFVAGSGATWFTGQSATWQTESLAQHNAASFEQWVYTPLSTVTTQVNSVGLPFVSFQTEAAFSNAVGVNGIALTSAGIQITTSGPHGINSGDFVVLTVPGALLGAQYLYAWAPTTTALFVAAQAGGAWTSGGQFAPMQWGITAITVGATTLITTSHAHGLSAGNTVFLANITGTVAASLNLTALVVLSAGLTSTQFEVAVSTTGLTYTGGGVGGVAGGVSGSVSYSAVAETGAIVQTIAPHGFSSGQYIALDSITGGTAATNLNSVWPIGFIDTTHFVIFGIQGGSGVYTSGGFAAYTGVYTSPATTGGSYIAPSQQWDRVGLGGSITIARESIRLAGPPRPPTAAPAVNSIDGSGANTVKFWGLVVTSGTGGIALVDPGTSGFNVGPLSEDSSGNTAVEIGFATKMANVNYCVTITAEGPSVSGGTQEHQYVCNVLSGTRTVTGFKFTVYDLLNANGWSSSSSPGYVTLNTAPAGLVMHVNVIGLQ